MDWIITRNAQNPNERRFEGLQKPQQGTEIQSSRILGSDPAISIECVERSDLASEIPYGIDKILFATDFSQASRRALQPLASLAARMGAEIVTVHAIPSLDPAEYPESGAEEYLRNREEVGWIRLRRFFRTPHLQGIPVHPRLRYGMPEQVINALAVEEGATLCVVIKHGRDRLERFFVGSTTERILREGRIPVLVLPDHENSPWRWDSILAAVDFSDTSRVALEFAVQFCESHGMQLRVVHVMDEVQGNEFADAVGVEKLKLAIENRSRRLRDAVSMHSNRRDIAAEVRTGRPADEILSAAREAGCSIVVLGSRGHSLQSAKGLGATAHAVLRSSDLPLLFCPWSALPASMPIR